MRGDCYGIVLKFFLTEFGSGLRYSGRLVRWSPFIKPCREVLQRAITSVEDRISDPRVELVSELVGAAYGFDVPYGLVVSPTNGFSTKDIARTPRVGSRRGETSAGY